MAIFKKLFGKADYCPLKDKETEIQGGKLFATGIKLKERTKI